jgi:hypothetical protein
LASPFSKHNQTTGEWGESNLIPYELIYGDVASNHACQPIYFRLKWCSSKFHSGTRSLEQHGKGNSMSSQKLTRWVGCPNVVQVKPIKGVGMLVLM